MKKYLFMHDYGMGGIWMYVIAEDPVSVINKYPQLVYVESEPGWLAEHEANHPLQVFDIKDNPTEIEHLRTTL